MSGLDVIVLGAGPAGLAAANGLARRGLSVHLVEAQAAVGGNAGSFELAGLRVDFGSHRLHPASHPAVFAELRELLGEDLLERPRHGRIRLLGRWIHFPLRPLDLALRVDPRFAAGVGLDLARKLLPGLGAGGGASRDETDTFASVLERGLGRTICRDFYFPYARKIWGIEPGEISAVQATKRVSSGSLGAVLRRLLPGGTGSGAAQSRGIFYYPRRGYGQISESLAAAAEAAGAQISLGSRVTRVHRAPQGGFEVELRSGDETRRLAAPRVWSTLPITVLARFLDPSAPEEIRRAAENLELRALLLIYLVLDVDRFTGYDAHYFPGADVPFTRISEPKNYTDLAPRGRTVLCVEMPCSPSDEVWSLEDGALGERVADGLARSGLPLPCPIREVVTRRLPAAYPVYRSGFETQFDPIDRWLADVEGLLSFGRQGLFVHDNTHHALYMARAAVACLRDDGSFDERAWQREREIFETHVVED